MRPRSDYALTRRGGPGSAPPRAAHQRQREQKREQRQPQPVLQSVPPPGGEVLAHERPDERIGHARQDEAGGERRRPPAPGREPSDHDRGPEHDPEGPHEDRRVEGPGREIVGLAAEEHSWCDFTGRRQLRGGDQLGRGEQHDQRGGRRKEPESQAAKDHARRARGPARHREAARDQQEVRQERCRGEVQRARVEERGRAGEGELGSLAEMGRDRGHERGHRPSQREPARPDGGTHDRCQRSAQEEHPALPERPVVIARDEPEGPHREQGRGERKGHELERRAPRRRRQLPDRHSGSRSQSRGREREGLPRKLPHAGCVDGLAGAVAHDDGVGAAGLRIEAGGKRGRAVAQPIAAHASPSAGLGGAMRRTTPAAAASRSASCTTLSRPSSVIR